MIRLTGDWAQWAAVGFGFIVIAQWNLLLTRRDPVTFDATWGSRSFAMLAMGGGMMGCIQGAVTFWGVPHAIRTFHLAKADAGLTYGSMLALGALCGSIAGGATLDRWRAQDERAPVLMIAVCLLLQLPAVALMLTATSPTVHMIGFGIVALTSGIWPPGAATMVQEITEPRARASAAAAYNLSVILLMLTIGPYAAGKISTVSGSLTLGIASLTMLAVPTLIFVSIGAKAVRESFRQLGPLAA